MTSLLAVVGIQRARASPDDPTFSETDNHYDLASYKRICNKFGVHPTTDFRFISGPNHGLESVSIYCHNPFIIHEPYPSAKAKFDDEDPRETEKGNSVCFIRNDIADT